MAVPELAENLKSLLSEVGGESSEDVAQKSFLEKLLVEVEVEAASLDPEAVAETSDNASDREFDLLLRAAEEKAALSGSFLPDDLLDASIMEPDRSMVLNSLFANCKVDSSGEKVRWVLRSDRRAQLLSEMATAENNSDPSSSLAKWVERGGLPETDLFGKMLRELCVKGFDISIDDRSQEELLALASAIEACFSSTIDLPDLSEIRQRIERTRFLSDYDVLLNHRFVGRKEQLAELHEFVSDISDRFPPKSVAITGVGGSGKSTLVSRFAREIYESGKATFSILDFDRPGIDASDETWLESEIARQVAVQYPESREALRYARHESREIKNEEIDYHIESDSESSSESRGISISREIGWALSDSGGPNKPLLLILDTFEEVTQSDLTGRIVEWILEFGERIMPTPLRVIYAGRLFERDLAKLKAVAKSKRIEVGELSRPDAELLLLDHGLPKPEAVRVAASDILPRRPLELKLLARLIRDNPEVTVDQIEEDIRNGGKSAAELFGGIIYRRVLKRIKDPLTKELACPGLVLRYVNPELVQNVLAPALKMPALTEKQAEAALDQLAKYEWLAYRSPSGDIVHRRDLRRSMLKAMMASEPESARRISETAIEFFSGPNRSQNDAAEAMYHRLLTMDEPEKGDSIDAGYLKAAGEQIKKDMLDFPPPGLALTKYALTGRVPVEEVRFLPSRYLRSAYSNNGRRLFENREFGQALKLIKRGTREGIAFENAEDSWEIDTLFATASWSDLDRAIDRKPDPNFRNQFAALIDELYPRELIGSSRIDADSLGKLLDSAGEFGRRALPEKLLPLGVKPFVVKLSQGLVYFNYRSSFDPHMRDSISTIGESIENLRDLPRGATFHRKLQLFRLLGREGSMSAVHFSPSMLKLDHAWFSEFPKFARNVPDCEHLLPLVAEAGERFSGDKKSRRRTVRMLLSEIDSLYKSRKNWTGRGCRLSTDSIDASMFLEFYRGPDTDFRDPCRFAILEAYPDRKSHFRLGEIIRSILRIDLRDLEPEKFADAIAANPERSFEIYIELVDRTWSLGKLLDVTNMDRPGPVLERLQRIYRNWDAAYRSAFSRPARMPN